MEIKIECKYCGKIEVVEVEDEFVIDVLQKTAEHWYCDECEEILEKLL